MSTVTDVHNLVRSLVGEKQTPPEVFTDTFLLTFSPEVYREIQRRFAAAGSMFSNDTVQFNLAIGVLSAGVGTVGWPALNIIKPLRLWERAQASSLFADFVEMEEADPDLIPRAQTIPLTHWDWDAGVIGFIGSTATRTVLMKYVRYLADLTAVGDTLLIPDSVGAMGYGTASAAVLSRGGVERAKEFESSFDLIVQNLIDNDKARNAGA